MLRKTSAPCVLTCIHISIYTVCGAALGQLTNIRKAQQYKGSHRSVNFHLSPICTESVVVCTVAEFDAVQCKAAGSIVTEVSPLFCGGLT